MLRVRHEPVGEPDHGFGRAEKDDAVRGQAGTETSQNVALRRRVKINQHVAAIDDVERPERFEWVQQVQWAEIHHLA